jgi:hypothetical protein
LHTQGVGLAKSRSLAAVSRSGVQRNRGRTPCKAISNFAGGAVVGGLPAWGGLKIRWWQMGDRFSFAFIGADDLTITFVGPCAVRLWCKFGVRYDIACAPPYQCS